MSELVVGTLVAGRYEVLASLGAAGTADVYLAKDRGLERKVALQLHHAGADVRRDALVMAKLSHPNIVTVLEVGEHDGRTFVTTDHIEGITLREWLGEQRSFDDILELLLAAGDGLAAAHDATLVHRAFTVDSVIVGSDGRARVGNFTSGDDTTADRVAFCAVGSDALRGGRTAIQRVLSRGEHYPSMRALVSALRTARSRRRVVAGSIAVVLLGAGTVVGVAWPSAEEASSCEGAGMAILTIGLDVPARIASAGYPTAAVLAEKRLAAYRAVHIDTAERVCRNRVTGEWGSDLHRRGELCLELERRLRRVILAHDPARPTSAPDLVDRVVRIQDDTACADATVLASAPAISDDPAVLASFLKLRTQIASAVGNFGADRYDRFDRVIAEAEASPAGTLPDIVLRIADLRGNALRERGKLVESEAMYSKAYFTARGYDDPEATLHSAADMILSTSSRGDEAATRMWLRNGIADAQRIRQRAPLAAGRFYAIAASTADGFGDPREAMTYLDEAFALFGETPSRALGDALMTRASIHITLGKPAEAHADYVRAIQMFESLYGADHPYLASIKINASAGMFALNKPDEAQRLAKEGEAILARIAVRDSSDIAQLEINLGVHYIAEGDFEKARKFLDDARRVTAIVFHDRHPDITIIDANLAYILAAEQNWDAAIQLARETLTLMESVLPPHNEHRGQVLLTLADAARAKKDHATAITSAEASADEYVAGDERKVLSLLVGAMVANDERQGGTATRLLAKVAALPAPSEPQLIGRIAYERGRALVNTKGDRAAAIAAFDTAIQIFREAKLASWQKEATAARAELK